MPGLGRRIAPDPRDTSYPMAAVLPARSPRTYRYWWANGLWADQGNTATCVGHAWAHWVEDGPVTWPESIDPFQIYREATLRDPWPENDNGDLQFGTSVRAGAKWLHETDRISAYRWAWDLDTVILALLEEGPVVIGSYWYSSMFTPDSNGMVEVTGSPVGGHAYVLNGVNTEREVVRFKNSWSRSWANKGHAWLRFTDLRRLIDQDGEVCLALERLVN